MTHIRNAPLAVVAVVVTTAVSGGIALGQGSSGAPSGSASAVAGISAGQLAAFEVLGHPRSADDEITAGSASVLAEQLREIAQANVALARRIGSVNDAARAWLVPGNDQLCVVTDEGVRASFQCVPTDVAASGYAVQTRSGGPGRGVGPTTVMQLLPDSVDKVTVTSAASSAETVAVTRNWVQTRMDRPSAIRFDRDGAPRTVSLGELPT